VDDPQSQRASPKNFRVSQNNPDAACGAAPTAHCTHNDDRVRLAGRSLKVIKSHQRGASSCFDERICVASR
jgi:hypothetical protein